MASQKTAPTQGELDAAQPPDLEVIKTSKTEDGLRWHYESAGDRVRVYVTTPEGRQLNRVAADEKAGRAALRDFLRAESE